MSTFQQIQFLPICLLVALGILVLCHATKGNSLVRSYRKCKGAGVPTGKSKQSRKS